MAITATTLTQGNSTTDATSYAAAVFTPTLGDFLLCAFVHRVTTGPSKLAKSVRSGNFSMFPLAHAILNGYNGGTRDKVLELWGVGWSAEASNTYTIDFGTGNTKIGIAWAFLGIGGTADAFRTDDRSVLKQIASLGSQNSTHILSTPVVDPVFSLRLANKRAAGNGVLLAVAHFVNEATTPGSGLTEKADQANADIGGLEVSFAATYQQTLSAHWATGTAQWAGIAVELSAPGNPTFVSNPESVLNA